MAIKESDTDDVRRKIDEQDRLDAEEIMVTAMLGSAGSVSSRSSASQPAASLPNHRRFARTRPPTSLSVSNKRRFRPPAIPPPPMVTKEPEADPVRKWNKHKAFAFVILFLSAAGVIVAVVINKGNVLIPRSVKITSVPVIFLDKPVRLRNMISQSNRIEHTKYNGTAIPSFIHTNVKDFTDRNTSAEVPVLWRIPFSGDEVWTEIMGTCLGFTQVADERELLGSHLTDEELMYVETPKGTFFNLDLSDDAGIEQAKAIKLATLDRVDAITSPNLHVLSLFDNLELRSRAFTTFCHPATRLVSYFYGSKDTNSRYYDPSLEGVSLEQYAAWPGDREEFNFMVKSLVSSGNRLVASEEINRDDLELAKAILQEKFMILLIDDKFGSWTKLDVYMGWPYSTQDRRQCEDSLLTQDWPKLAEQHPPVGANEAAYSQLVERNRWDMELYDFAVHLFQQQTDVLVK